MEDGIALIIYTINYRFYIDVSFWCYSEFNI